MSSTITFQHPVLHERDTLARLVSVLEFDGRYVDMWYEVPKEYAHWFSKDRADGFVVGFILQAMQMRKDIVTHAPMSSKLWHNLTLFFIPMMAKAFQNLHVIRILPSSLIETTTPATAVAGGFSGGIDSFAAIVDHFVNEKSPNYRMSHFLFHNVGSHGDKDYQAARTMFRQRYETLREYPVLVGVPFVPVDSNIHEIVPTDFVKTYITLNASVPLVLQNHFRKYFYASSYKNEDCGVNKTDIVGRFDPFAFHMLSTETLECISTGGQLSRVEKTKLVAGYEMSRRFLNVCIAESSEGKNCSTCIKCCRTLLTLDLFGLAGHYPEVFDLKRFAEVRRRYIKKEVLRAPKGGFEYEILELGREICNEPWARRLRRKQARKETVRHIKSLMGKCRAQIKRRIKELAPSASTALGKVARKLHLR
jgi:hypothetical protein